MLEKLNLKIESRQNLRFESTKLASNLEART